MPLKSILSATLPYSYAAIVALAFSAAPAIKADNGVRVIDYCPAPTQFANLEIAIDPSAAAAPLKGATDDTTEGVTTLGSFGGYVVLAFDKPVLNHPKHRYGVDFVIGGNALSSGSGESCEPAAVQVMADTNGNGIPDDGPWLELAGSEYYLLTSQRGFSVTYTNPCYNTAHQVWWKASDGSTGAVLPTSYRSNVLYPDPYLLPDHPEAAGVPLTVAPDAESMTFTGTRIRGYYDLHNPKAIKMFHTPAFGYADMRAVPAGLTPAAPHNPYFADSNGEPIDGFDISWAVDADGNHVELDHIDFIRIYTAGLQNGGWTGEWSSEISGVMLTEPDDTYEPTDICMHYLGGGAQRIAVGASSTFTGLLFKNGIPQSGGNPAFTLGNSDLAALSKDGNVTPKTTGKTTLSYSQTDAVDSYTVDLWVTKLTGVVFVDESDKTSAAAKAECRLGTILWLNPMSIDNSEEIFAGESGNRYQFDTYRWYVSNPSVGTVDAYGTFTPSAKGTTVVTAESMTDPSLYAEIQITVKEPAKLQQTKKTLAITREQPAGALATRQIWMSADKSLPLVTGVETDSKYPYFRVEHNRLVYDCAEATESFVTTISLTADYRGTKAQYPIEVTYDAMSGIADIESDAPRLFPAEVYDACGRHIGTAESMRQLEGLTNGLYIVRYASGLTEKHRIAHWQ